MPARTQRAARRLAWLALASLGSVAALCKPPPDPDGVLAGARPLALDQWHNDQLLCRKNDCADWYRVETPGRGDLQVVVVASQESSAARPFALQLTSSRGEALARSSNTGAGNTSVRVEAERGAYLLEISATDRDRQPLPYEVRAAFRAAPRPPPPPPEPRFELLESEVLEVEGRAGDPRAVLIDVGRNDGIRPGMRGRLREDGRAIATVEIEDVYPDGSRARIEGTLEAPITPDTVVEIDIPVDAP